MNTPRKSEYAQNNKKKSFQPINLHCVSASIMTVNIICAVIVTVPRRASHPIQSNPIQLLAMRTRHDVIHLGSGAVLTAGLPIFSPCRPTLVNIPYYTLPTPFIELLCQSNIENIEFLVAARIDYASVVCIRKQR